MSHGSWHLHGHIHSAGSAYNELNRRQGLMCYDVDMDANGLAPVSLDEVRARFDGVEFQGRARWWEWVNGANDPDVARDCEAIRELMVETPTTRCAGPRRGHGGRRSGSG